MAATWGQSTFLAATWGRRQHGDRALFWWLNLPAVETGVQSRSRCSVKGFLAMEFFRTIPCRTAKCSVFRLRFIQDVNEGIVVLRFLEDRIAIISTIERVVNNPRCALSGSKTGGSQWQDAAIWR